MKLTLFCMNKGIRYRKIGYHQFNKYVGYKYQKVLLGSVMFSSRLTTIFMTLILLILMPSTLFAEVSLNQEKAEDPRQARANGISLARIDGFIDNNAPAGFINEWADAQLSTVSLLGTNKNELLNVEVQTKIVMDRILVAINVPMDSLSLNFEEIKVTYDINPDGVLSDGDIRLSMNLISGAQTVEVFSKSGFTDVNQLPGLGLNQKGQERSILEFSNVAAYSFEKAFQAEFDFSLSMWAELGGTKLTIVGSDFGTTAYSVVLISNGQNGREAFGYPDMPYALADGVVMDFAVGSFTDFSYVRNPSIPSIFQVDLGVDFIEVTQSVQTLNNDLSLVRNKPTLARVYLNNPTGDPMNVEVRLTGYFESPGGILINKGTMTQTFLAPTRVDRGSLGNSANFLLPTSWTNNLDYQTLRLKAEVTTAFRLDSNLSDNILIENVYFGKTHDMNIYYIQVNEGTAEAPSLISDIDPAFIPQALDEFRSYYPSANPNFIELDWQMLGVWTGTKDELKDELNDLASTITLASLFAILLGVDPNDVTFPDQVFGFTTSGAGSSTPPWGGYTQSYAAWGGLGAKRGPGVLSHEVNHNIGDDNWGRHTPGCTATGTDPNWPKPTSQVITQTYSDTLGWQYITSKLIGIKSDFMSYCMGGSYSSGDTYPDSISYPISWVSDYRWELLFDKLSTFTPGSPQPMYTQNTEINKIINQIENTQTSSIKLNFDLDTTRIVSGTIFKDGQGTLNPSYTVPGKFDFQIPQIANPTHFLEVNFLDKSQAIIPISPTFDDVYDDGIHEPPNQQGFSFWLPDSSNILSVVLTDANGNQLSQLQGTEFFMDGTLGVPTSYKRGDSFVPNFNFDSQNSTALFTQLQYSQDGLLWYDYGPQTLGVMPTFSMSLLPGGTGAQFRVRVTDGFDTIYILGSNTVSVKDLPPTLQLLSSDSNIVDERIFKIVRGSTLSLYANGYDPETGAIGDDNYIWTLIGSNGDVLYEVGGQIFSNPIFDDVAKIEVRVTDPAGQTTVKALQLEVNEPDYTPEKEYKEFKVAIDEIYDPVDTTKSDVPTSTDTKPEDTSSASVPLPFTTIIAALIMMRMKGAILRRKEK